MYATLTIPALKTLISEMNVRRQYGDIPVPSKARKADIIALIEQEISRVWAVAIASDEARDAAIWQASPAYRHFSKAVNATNSYRAALDMLHSEAIAENRTRVTRKIVDGYRKSVSIEPYVYPVRPVPSLMARAEILAGKVNAYFRQNGAIKLTPAQWRRISKAMAKHAVTYADMVQFLVFP